MLRKRTAQSVADLLRRLAMTEAAIGSALTTVVFLFAWSRIRSIASRDDSTNGEVR